MTAGVSRLRGIVERHRLLAAGVVVVVGMLTTVLVVGATTSAAPARIDATHSTAERDTGSAGHLQDPVAAPTAAAAGTPVSLRIPAIGVSADALEDLGTTAAGKLLPPVAADAAGWYGAGVVPGQVGPAIIAGHIDYSAGPGIFEHLHELQPGAVVEVGMSTGRVLSFRVTGSTESPKAQFPTSEVYGTVPDAQLRLISCAGDFDRATSHYRDNLIVFATLIPDPKG